MKRTISSVFAGVCLTITSLAGLQLSAMGPAWAKDIGTVSFEPVAGLDVHPMSAFTSAPCPQGTHLIVKIFGNGFPADGINGTSNSEARIYRKGSNGGLEIPLLNTMRTFADQQGPRTTLGGRYDVVVTCKNKASQASLGDFKGSLTFTTPTQYTSGDGKTPVATRVPDVEGDPTGAAAVAPAMPLDAAPQLATSQSAPGSNRSSGSGSALLIGLALAALAAVSFALGRRRSGAVA